MRATPWVLGLLALSTAAVAGDAKMQPGMWEYTMKMEMPGMPVAMPPQTFQNCMTQQDIDRGDYSSNPRDKSKCEVKNMKREPGKVSYDVVCTGERKMTGHYDFTLGTTSMSGGGTMNMDGGQVMKQNFSAKRVGDCPK